MRKTDFEVLTLVRDAKLPANVKAILYAVEMRGEHFGKWETLAADAGLSKNSYYRARALVDRGGLLNVVRRFNSSNVVTVNADALRGVPRHSHISESKRGDPETPQRLFPDSGIKIPIFGKDDSQIGEPKGNTKGPHKGPNRSTTEEDSQIGESSPLATDRETPTPEGSDRAAAQSSPPRQASDSEQPNGEDLRMGSSLPPRQACPTHASSTPSPWCRDCT